MTQLGDLTTQHGTTRVGTASQRNVLLVPLGATEQHGPHLPLSTDTDIAVAWCRAMAQDDDNVLIAPPLPYGSSGEHQSFWGTMSIGQDALETLVVELGRSASESFAAMVFVSGHAGNAQPLSRAVGTLRSEGRSAFALFPQLDGSDAHAGRTETSLMLHLHPDRVDRDRAEAGCTAPLSEILDEMIAGGVGAVAPNGVLGDPAGASADEGAALLSQLVDLGGATLAQAGEETDLGGSGTLP